MDRASSMKDHWPQAQLLLEILALKCRYLDTDGMDLDFTNSDRRLRNESITLQPIGQSPFYKVMREAKVMPTDNVLTDMAQELGIIFQEYLDMVNDLAGKQVCFISVSRVNVGLAVHSIQINPFCARILL